MLRGRPEDSGGGCVIVDCSMWFNEWDALKWRLRTLEDMVDVFVVVEGDMTFQGEPKPWRLTDRWAEFSRWSDRMIWERVDLSGDRWERQKQQRRAMRERARQASPGPDDVVVFSDVEEVWGPEMPGRWPDTIVVAQQDMRVLRPEWRRNTGWCGSIGGPWRLMGGEDWQSLRDRRFELPRQRSGWHLTWMGGADACRQKAAALSDDKYRNVDFTRLLAERRWVDRPLTDVGDRPEWTPDSW